MQEAETRISASPVLATGGVKRPLPIGPVRSPIPVGFGTHRPRFSHEPGVSRHIRTRCVSVAPPFADSCSGIDAPICQDTGLAARGESRSYDGSTQSIRRTTLTRMAMGTRETDQPPLWIATSDLPPSPGHPFYARLTTLLDGHHFDRFVEGLCARFYAPVMGRPSLAPGRYFRLLLVGYFEGIDSERGMAWRATDSLAVRSFLRLAVDEAPPDHSTIARTRRLIDLETHRTVFTWVQQRLVEAGRLTGKTIAIDATTLEANAAMRSIVRRDTGESSQAFLAGLATASGIETPTREALARLDRKRKKKTSNTDWTHPHDPDAKVTKMKDGRTHLAHKAEHAVDMETGAIVAVTLHGADVGDTHDDHRDRHRRDRAGRRRAGQR